MKRSTSHLALVLMFIGSLCSFLSCRNTASNNKEEAFLGKWNYSTSSEGYVGDTIEDGTYSGTVTGVQIFKSDNTGSFTGNVSANFDLTIDEVPVTFEVTATLQQEATWSVVGDSLLEDNVSRNYKVHSVKAFVFNNQTNEKVDVSEYEQVQEKRKLIKETYEEDLSITGGRDAHGITSIKPNMIILHDDEGAKEKLTRIE